MPYLNALPDSAKGAQTGLEELSKVNIHYLRKENLIPVYEKYGITAPPKMWGVDDEIRAQIKEAMGLPTKRPPTSKKSRTGRRACAK